MIDHTDAPEEAQPHVRLPDVEALKRKFRQAMDASDAARQASALDRGYFDGNRSISDEWQDYARKNHMVAQNTNIVGPLIEGFIGFVLSQNTSPQAWPRNASQQQAADVATKLIRYAADRARIDEVKADCVENFYIEGYMACVLEATPKTIRAHRIHPNELFWDPYSREANYSDALYMGIAKWLHLSQIDHLYPDAHKYGDITPGDMLGGTNSTNRDVPDLWIDQANRRIMTVEMFYLEGGEWQRIVFCHAGVLDFGPSAYQDDEGNSICPIVAMSAYVCQDQDDAAMTYARYGVARRMQSVQDEYNSRKAASIRAAIDKRVQQTNMDAPEVSADIVRGEAAKPNGVLPSGWSTVPSNDFAQHTALLQLNRAEIDRMAPTPALLGRTNSDSQSGRSRMIAQQAGGTELQPMINRIERWYEELCRRLWFAARQFWRGPMDVRITQDGKAPSFLQVNTPVMTTRLMPVMGPDGNPIRDPHTGHPILKPQPVQTGTHNELARLDMDISIVAVPEAVTLAHETWTTLGEIAKTVPIGSPQFLMALQLAPLPNKAETIDTIKSMMAEEAQQAAAAQQAQLQATIEAKNLANAEIQAKTAGLIASANKHQAEAQRTSVEATQMAANATAEASRAAILHHVASAVTNGTRVTDMTPAPSVPAVPGAQIPTTAPGPIPGAAVPEGTPTGPSV